ncbi:MAG: hypothetical protein QOG41_1387 [Thermoleophilaceae bacterium]|nr:hypothetical protein [Thermoleophilaceae bacterium]MEA2367968.1 hypothetical protein [Thermoleophilaceae bacterium]MEA2388614.1 hypothetical protein [Thermoleophilaceae bacterium]
MSRLALRRGLVVTIDRRGTDTELTVDVDGVRRPAVAYEDLTGPVEVGDEVVVNIAARDLGLGSGGFDLVHANLSRGLAGSGIPDAHVMKLNYTSLQHAVEPVEERAGELELPLDRAVAVISLHAQLPCVAWAAAERRPGTRLGYVQTAGGALPGALSRVVRTLRERGLLAGHVTAGPAFGGEHDAITVAGGLHAGLTALGWDAAIVGPGPGILGSATALGHGGLAALDNAHAALALGCRTVVVPRMSSGDERPRHRGLSHHTRTVLDLLLRPVIVAVPSGEAPDLPDVVARREAETDVAGYAGSGLPARTMGRSIEDDELFFRAALAGGTVLAEEV